MLFDSSLVLEAKRRAAGPVALGQCKRGDSFRLRKR